MYCSIFMTREKWKLKSVIFLEDLQPSEITHVRHTFQVTGMADDGERLTGAETMDRHTTYYSIEHVPTCSRAYIRCEFTHYL